MTEYQKHNSDSSLPPGWVRTTVGEVRVDRSQSVDPRKVPGQTFELYSVPSHAEGQPEITQAGDIGSSKQTVEPGTVLLCKINPRISRTWVVGSHSRWPKIASTEWIPFFEVPGIQPRYLSFFMQQHTFRGFLAMHASGVGGSLMRVKPSTFEDYPFPLAPLPEQRRIVEAIEAQFSRLDAAVAALKRAQANLERYKASVLQAACEGRLVPTEDELARQEGRDYEPADVLLERILAERRRKWEEAQWAELVEKAQKKVAQARRKAAGRPARLSDLAEEEWREVPEAEYAGYLPKGDRWKAKYEEPVGPDTEGLPALPAGWVWTTLEHIGELARGKSTHRPRNDPHLFGGPYPFIQTGEVRAAEGTITSYETTYSEFGLGQSRLWPRGTLCITIAANIAETALLGFDGCFPDSVVGFLAADGVSVEFIEFFLRTAQRQLENDAPATAQKNINLNTLRQLAIPIAPLGEQLRIVDALERRLSILADLAMSTNNSLMRTDRLRQSILKRAFEGRLVPQDPDDEPASVLLARIRDEAEAEVTPTQDRLPGV